MDGSEIANAYLALYVQMPNVKRDIEKQLGAADVDSTGRGLGGKLMGGIKVGAIAGAAVTAGAVVGTLGVALTKGFGRLVALDQAEAKLTGLGHSAESVETIMNNALGAVRGTAFGMDEAATTAAGVVAAGIKPGQDLERILSLVADSATIAGSSMGDMGAIFNKVAAGGVLQGEEIAQLGDRGIPILQFLAEEMGVTAQEAKELASAGEVSFDTFAAAMERGLGGAAASSGDTFTGALANVNAALGRIGAGLLGGVFPQLAPMFQDITELLGPLEDKAAALGQTLGEWFGPALQGGVQEVAGGFRAMFGAFRDGDDDVTSSGFAGFLETIGVIARDLVDSGLLEFMSPLGLAFEVLEPVLPMIAETLGQVAAILGGALMSVLPTLLPVLAQIVALFSGAVAEIIPALLPLLVQVAELFASVFTALEPLLPLILELIQAALPIVTALLLALIPVVEGIFNAFGTLLIPIVDTLVGVLGGLITFLTGVFTGNWEKAWQGVQDIFGSLFGGIVGIAEGIVNSVIDIINGFIGGLNEFGNFVSDISGGTLGWDIGTVGHVDWTPEQAQTGGAFTGTPVNMSVYAAPGMDETAIGTAAANQLNFAMRK